MKNKGYTLLELLGVIVILSVLVILVFPSVINFIKKGNDKIGSITHDLIISAAEEYINDNSSNLYLTSGKEYCISVDTLIGRQYLSDVVKDSDFASKKVKVNYTNKTNYEIVDRCSVCQFVSGTDISSGIKYQCKVKDIMETGFEEGYYFYLLSTNEDETMNLIMERNMHYDKENDVGKVATSTNPGIVKWYADSSDNTYGPITAMDYLHKVTKDWDNVDNIIIDYNDEGKCYGSIKLEGDTTVITKTDGTITSSYENLKSRLPYRYELNNYNTKNVYLYNYMALNENIQKDVIDEIKGYWSLSSYLEQYVSLIYFGGYVGGLSSNTSGYGVRPVITVKNVIELN